MAVTLRDLAANVAARRARREAAFLAVHGLRGQPAITVGRTIVGWLRSAYHWQPRIDAVEPPDWILERERQTLLLRAVNGDYAATWQDIDELAVRKAHGGIDLVALAAPAGVPEPEELLGMPWEGLRTWGSLELERIYVEIEHEIGGMEF